MPKYRQQPLRAADEEFSSQTVASSSIELFQLYRIMLSQCAKLSTGTRLLELSAIFGKYLDQYAQQALLTRFSSSASSSGGQSNSFSKGGLVALPPLEDVIIILNTADYCYLTCGQLEEKVRGRMDADLKAKVDLHSQQDGFMGVASAAIRTLVRMVDLATEPAWREMRNIAWAKLDTVGDQSPFVSDLVHRVKVRVADILQLLVKPQYARAFCDNLVELMANTYLANILLCKPISETGAEQVRPHQFPPTPTSFLLFYSLLPSISSGRRRGAVFKLNLKMKKEIEANCLQNENGDVNGLDISRCY